MLKVIAATALCGILASAHAARAQADSPKPDSAQMVSAGCAVMERGMATSATDTYQVGICEGAVYTTFQLLDSLHKNYYVPRFGEYSFPIKNVTVAKAYLASLVLVGPDVCFPAGILRGDAIAAVNNFTRAHPDKITAATSSSFVSAALGEAFGCKSPGHP